MRANLAELLDDDDAPDDGKYERILKSQIERHEQAIENNVQETLPELELQYLIHLAKIDSIEDAATVMGMTITNGRGIAISLTRKGAMAAKYVKDNKWNFYIDPKFKEALKKLNTDKTKSVFGSKLAVKLYKQLRQEHLFVYPEVPLAAFIKKEYIEHLLEESWHSSYFLMCRLDFLITDQNGMPKFGVEYQGGYHENENQKVKDDFKRKLMNEAGLEIKYYDYSDLNDEE